MGGGDMGIGFSGGRGRASGPFSLRRSPGIGGYKAGRGFGYRPSTGYDPTGMFAGIEEPYGADIYRYGEEGERDAGFPWTQENYNPNPPPPPSAVPPPSDPGIGGPDGGAQDSHPGDLPQATSWGDFMDRVLSGAGMFGMGGLLRGLVGRDMDVRSAQEAVNSMNMAGGAMNPELQGRSYGQDYGGGSGDYTGGVGVDVSGAEPSAPGMFAKGGRLRRNMGGIGYAVGGDGDGRDDKIPALLSDGEHVIPADVVAAYGRGSSKAGHERLNEMILKKRKQFRATLGKLPPPKG